MALVNNVICFRSGEFLENPKSPQLLSKDMLAKIKSKLNCPCI
jgi:hypothetical protein